MCNNMTPCVCIRYVPTKMVKVWLIFQTEIVNNIWCKKEKNEIGHRPKVAFNKKSTIFAHFYGKIVDFFLIAYFSQCRFFVLDLILMKYISWILNSSFLEPLQLIPSWSRLNKYICIVRESIYQMIFPICVID